MRNTLKNHCKVFGEDLGNVSWNCGFNVNNYLEQDIIEPFTQYLRQAKTNRNSDFEIGDYVNLMWFDKGTKSVCSNREELRVTHVNGVFLTVESFGDKSYKSFEVNTKDVDINPKYSYGSIDGGKWMFKLTRKVNAE